MKFELSEGLFPNDLAGLILPEFDIFLYEPKIEGDAIVVSFYAKAAEPAEDLSVFIEKSAVDHVLDTEVSSAPAETGNYLIFVELSKDATTDTIFELLNLCEHLCEIKNWKFTGYKLSKDYPASRKNVSAYLQAIKSGKIS
jgi:hypothetical protein